MLKSLPVAFIALFLLAGCVTVATPSTEPSAAATSAPSLGVTTPAPTTSAPTVAPTLAPTLPPPPTLVPTLEATLAPPPTEAPTNSATEEPSELPSAQASGAPSTRDLLFDDDMSDSTSGWQVLDQSFATISYDSGVLAFRFNQNPAWAISLRLLEAPASTLVQAATFAPQSGGFFGQLCGDSASATYYGAVVSTDGSLVFIETDNGKINVLDRQDNLGLTVTLGQSNAMALECSAQPDGTVQMIVGLTGTGPIATYRQANADITAFDVTGLYGEAASDGYTLAVDSAAAWGAGGADATMSDGAQILLAHIPTDLQKNCYESPVWNSSADFVVACVLQTKGKGAEIAIYKQYADANGMNSAYQDLVTAFGGESQGSCQTGPNEATWAVNEETGGRVQCAPQGVGIRFDWTDDLTNILGTLVDLEGSYPDTYSQWQDAGPVIPQG